MAKQNKDFGQKQGQPNQQGQQDMQDDRSDRESGKPVQLDADQKTNEKQGGEHQGDR